ncbi:MAG: mannose-1-phosphate guanylyltransferase/mannose-6-phosphate isomerase [Elusimicrobiota bacterium]
MKTIIMAGGSGTRLWPVSRENYPKQFIKINGESLLSKTYKRFLKLCDRNDIYIITNEKYKFYVINELFNLNKDIEKNLILEPVGKNTSGAIILSVKFLIEKIKVSVKESVFVTPSDHIILNEDEFIKYVKNAETLSKKGYIVTFGIKPTLPHTGYGYIKIGKQISKDFYKVDKFTEKPDIKKAEEYFKSGDYYWNSGMFKFSIATIMEEFKKYQPDMYKFFSLKYNDLIEKFNELKNISIDYTIMENTKKAVVNKSEIIWSDVGGWESFAEIIEKDDDNNVKVGNVFSLNAKDSIIYSDNDKLISLIDVKDIIVVNTDDALLIAKKGSGEKVKEVVDALKKQNYRQALEHTTVYRPWGSYTVLEEGLRYKIKRIVVKSGHKLSEQMHYHRSEHWVVIKGTARVIIDGKEHMIHENESIYVPKSTRHRLENPGKVDLELIEVQNGEYVGEDDIVRFDDIYGRR